MSWELHIGRQDLFIVGKVLSIGTAMQSAYSVDEVSKDLEKYCIDVNKHILA